MDDARNELFGHIHRCGVMRATREQQEEWMKDTIEFLGERFSALTPKELEELATIGMRFCSPVIANAEAEAESAPEAEAEVPAEAEQEEEPAAA
jgi:hypothetical protein